MKAKTCEEKVLQLLETEEQKNEALTEEVASLKEQLSAEKALTAKMIKLLVKLDVVVKRPSATENQTFSTYIHGDDYIWDHGDDEFKEFEQLLKQVMPKEEN
jgi:hypothetical protein